MEEIKDVDRLIDDALRIGEKIIVDFPNFAYVKARLMMFFHGRAPVTESLPYSWFDTLNVRFILYQTDPLTCGCLAFAPLQQNAFLPLHPCIVFLRR